MEAGGVREGSEEAGGHGGRRPGTAARSGGGRVVEARAAEGGLGRRPAGVEAGDGGARWRRRGRRAVEAAGARAGRRPAERQPDCVDQYVRALVLSRLGGMGKKKRPADLKYYYRPLGPVGASNRDQKVFRPGWRHQPGL